MDISQDQFKKFFDSLSNINNLILTGDFNAHDSVWSMRNADQRGKFISSILPNYDLNILNTTNSHTRTYKIDNVLRFSSPDISFASSDISMFINWSLLDNRGSDHRPIELEISNVNFKLNRFFKRINLSKVNWEKFASQLCNLFNFESIINEENALLLYNEFIESLYSSLESAGGKLPREEVSKEPPGVLWWNDECKNLVNNRREALNCYLNNSSVENFDRYMETVKIAKKGLKKEKKKGFENFCESLNPNIPYEIICKKAKNLKKRFLTSDEFSIPSYDIVNNVELNNCFDKISKKYVYNNFDVINQYPDRSQSILDEKVSEIEVRIAIERSKSKSAPGRDLISYEVLKNLPTASHKWLASFCNCVLENGIFPNEWNEYNVCFISKGKGKGYRPIALSNTILKVLERVINERLQWLFESSGQIPRNFFGFRRSKSCYDCLSILRTDIALAKINKELLGILSLDFKSAYDNVNVMKLVELFSRRGVPKKILNFLVNLMTNRVLYGFFGGVEIGKRSTIKGLPQGSILRPILFNIYIADIINKLTPSCKLISFADNILIYCSDKNIDIILDNLFPLIILIIGY